MGSDKLLPAAIGVEKDSPEGKQLTERRKKLFLERYLPDLKPTPGAKALVARLRADGFGLAVASSAEGDELQGLLAVCGASDLAVAGDADQSKPDPDVVQAALRKLDRPGQEVVMLGDTPYDLEAAQRAGIGIVALRCGGWDDDDLRGALAVYDDPADLLAHFATSTLGARR
jgi:HAD superfamily hydrolase (TIGR01509 family)